MARYLDHLLEPWMRFIVGDESEEPSVTHWWNTCSVDITVLTALRTIDMVFHIGDQSIRSHRMTRWGGLDRYLVIAPLAYTGVWYVGQLAGSHGWVSRIPTSGKKRVFIQPYPTHWFGLTPSGEQLRLGLCRTGYIGDQTTDHTIPLF